MKTHNMNIYGYIKTIYQIKNQNNATFIYTYGGL